MLQIHGYSEFHHLAYQRPLLEDWDLIKKKKNHQKHETHNFQCFIQDVLKWQWVFFFLNHKCVEESPWLTTSRVWCPYPDSCSGASSFLCCSLLQYQQCNWKQSCSRKSHESQKSQSTLCIFTTTCVLLLSIPIRKNTFWSVGAGDTSWAMPIYLLISKVKVKFYKQDINSVFMFAAQSLIQQHSNMKWHCPELYWLFIQCAFRNASCSKLFISLSATGWASLDKAITHPVRGFSDFGISSWKCWNKFWILKRLWYVRLKHVVPLSFISDDCSWAMLQLNWHLEVAVVVLSRSVVSDSLQPHGLQPARFPCPWNPPGKNTGVGCHFFLQGMFLTQGSNPGLLHCRQILYCLSHQGRPTSTLILRENTKNKVHTISYIISIYKDEKTLFIMISFL